MMQDRRGGDTIGWCCSTTLGASIVGLGATRKSSHGATGSATKGWCKSYDGRCGARPRSMAGWSWTRCGPPYGLANSPSTTSIGSIRRCWKMSVGIATKWNCIGKSSRQTTSLEINIFHWTGSKHLYAFVCWSYLRRTVDRPFGLNLEFGSLGRRTNAWQPMTRKLLRSGLCWYRCK